MEGRGDERRWSCFAAACFLADLQHRLGPDATPLISAWMMVDPAAASCAMGRFTPRRRQTRKGT